MSARPPPPDLASIKELVRDADTEAFIANGAPADEYDHEAEQLYATIGHFVTAELTVANIVPEIELIWAKNFGYSDDILAKARPKLAVLAQQIARFFGPEALPQVRERSQ